jgi:hypothetical protein
MVAMGTRKLARLVFEGGFGERDEHEARMRGYRSHVWAELMDGSRYQVTFYDMSRLAQTLEDERRSGRPFFTEPRLIVVSDVTLDNMEVAASTLAEEGFFDDKDS